MCVWGGGGGGGHSQSSALFPYFLVKRINSPRCSDVSRCCWTSCCMSMGALGRRSSMEGASALIAWWFGPGIIGVDRVEFGQLRVTLFEGSPSHLVCFKSQCLQYSENNDPYRRLREPLGVKGVRQSIVLTHNPSTIVPGQQLPVRFPNLGKHDVIVPGTARAFTITLDLMPTGHKSRILAAAQYEGASLRFRETK